MSWKLVDNPEYAGKTPRKVEAVCHDRTPFLTLQCTFCGAANHIHESQISEAPEDSEIAMRCSGCGLPNVTETAFIRGAFAQMREDGWI